MWAAPRRKGATGSFAIIHNGRCANVLLRRPVLFVKMQGIENEKLGAETTGKQVSLRGISIIFLAHTTHHSLPPQPSPSL